MEPKPDEILICPATKELVALARAVRPTWDEQELRVALAVCVTQGWAWPKILRYTVNMLTVADATPRSIMDAAQVPFSGGPVRRG
jgi:hypothetical protein